MAISVLSRRATRTIDWKAAALAGLIAGIGFVALEVLLNVFLFRGLVARLARMTVAVFLGEEVLAPSSVLDLEPTTAVVAGEDVLLPTAGTDPKILLMAFAVHLALSIVYAVILAWLIVRFRFGAAMWVGLAFGLVLYLFHFHALAEVYPWFREERGWVSVVMHLVFGGIVALEYKAFASRRKEAGAG